MSIDHYENFPVASVLCPPRLRPAVVAIYVFARTADDLADEGDASPAQRMEQLGRYRHALERCLSGQPATDWSGVFAPLGDAVLREGLEATHLHALLDAFEQDVRNPAYADRDDLLAYCARSANPVGRLLLHLYRVDDESALRQSDAICSALQLANFWQDLGQDLSRGRCYVPARDLARHGLDREQLLARPIAAPHRQALKPVLAELVGWTRRLMAQGAGLVHRVPGRAGWELRLVVQGGLRILDKIEAVNFDSLETRPTLGPADLPRLAWRAARMRAAPASA